VLRGAGDADLAPDPEEGGALTRVVRTAQKVLGDEAERLNVLDEALEAGAVVVGVQVASDEDDEDARDGSCTSSRRSSAAPGRATSRSTASTRSSSSTPPGPDPGGPPLHQGAAGGQRARR
jgi:hypothetical protein